MRLGMAAGDKQRRRPGLTHGSGNKKAALDDAVGFDRERGSAAAFLTMVTRFAAMERMGGRRRQPIMG
jgi:hypothetical protein